MNGSGAYLTILVIVGTLARIVFLLSVTLLSFFATQSRPRAMKSFLQQVITPPLWSLLYIGVLWIAGYTPAYGLFISIALQVGNFIVVLPNIREMSAK